MNKEYQKKILILALYAGELMMKSGAEIYRVEDTIVRICKACKVPFVECFATGTGIFLSLDNGGANDDMYTFLKRIDSTSIDLWKISEINSFSREFSTTDLSVEKGLELLKAIDAKKNYRLPLKFLGAGIVGPSFCLMFGGNIFDCLGSVLAVIAAYSLSFIIDRLKFNNFIRIFLSCALATFIALFLNLIGLTSLLGPVIIGSVTIFLPGVAITNSARDLLSGEMLAGLSRGTEALIAAVAIASGVGVILQLWHVLGGVI
jgi:uncharacterized membrane protein YjjP (DUF1212 family)